MCVEARFYEIQSHITVYKSSNNMVAKNQLYLCHNKLHPRPLQWEVQQSTWVYRRDCNPKSAISLGGSYIVNYTRQTGNKHVPLSFLRSFQVIPTSNTVQAGIVILVTLYTIITQTSTLISHQRKMIPDITMCWDHH